MFIVFRFQNSGRSRAKPAKLAKKEQFFLCALAHLARKSLPVSVKTRSIKLLASRFSPGESKNRFEVDCH